MEARAGHAEPHLRTWQQNLAPSGYGISEGQIRKEREVALAIAAGRSNAGMARQFFLSLPTVTTHISRVISKLGVQSRVQAARTVHRTDLAALDNPAPLPLSPSTA